MDERSPGDIPKNPMQMAKAQQQMAKALGQINPGALKQMGTGAARDAQKWPWRRY